MERQASHYDVVILGAGYAGLMTAFGLIGRRGAMRVAVVNESEQFVERIRLQEAVIAPVAPRLPTYRELFDGTNVEFVCGRAVRLLAVERKILVQADQGELELSFAFCVCALGSRHDVRSPGVAANAFRLDPDDGPRSTAALRGQLWALKGQTASVVVAGGGTTGVEAAAEIKSQWPDLQVTMLAAECAGDIGKGVRVRELARTGLRQLGVRMVDDDPVSTVEPDAVITKSGRRFEADVCVWAGGLRGSQLAREAGLAVDSHDRVWVDPTLRSISYPAVFAIGDAAHPVAPTGARYRPSAFAAITSGAYVAKAIVALKGTRKLRPYSFTAIGQGVAVGRVGLGFLVFPNDGDGYGATLGERTLRFRNFVVRAILEFLKWARRWPGRYPFWLGRGRVSWSAARKAMESDRRPEDKVVPVPTDRRGSDSDTRRSSDAAPVSQ